MANVQVKDIRKDKRKQNYDSCKAALDQTGEALLPFTEDKLKDLHQQISLQVGNQPVCHQQCSKVMRDVNRWCITCGLWRQALLRFHTNPRELVWHKLQSWEWPKHHMNLVEVYMWQNWGKADMNASDLSVALTVWRKCSVFPATILPLADKLKKSRNKIAHGKSLDENEKQTVFNNIKQVIQHADVVKCLQNPNEILKIITDLENGCLQEYSPLLPTSPLLVDYFKQHGPLVGRGWLFQLLDEHLNNTKKNGILLEAGMGYGKSAIAAHITCAKEGDQGMEMRKRLIAFHVCKFDVKKTHQAGVFIQRLVSMISNNIPEFNDTINDCLHSFNTEQCDSDPFGCIDECIIFPLKQTNISDERKGNRLILIDALDECYGTFLFEKSNKLFNLIERRAHMLPSWIKLLVTSKRLSRNERLEYNLDRIYFHNLEPRNLNDIDLYFNQSNASREKSVTFFQLAVNADPTQPNQMSDLNSYYRDQFDRWYDHGFDLSKSILEALLTTSLQKYPDNIRKVISSNVVHSVSPPIFEKELSIIRQFTDKVNGEIEFKHFSLVMWLLEKCPREYRLSLSDGHQANAHYILYELNTSNITFDVTDLLLHIHYAKADSGLHEEFINIPKHVIFKMEEKFHEGPVVRIIKKGKMKEIPEVLFHHFPGGNHFSAENISVGFIAAENGYTYALKQLVNHDADIHFRMPTFSNILTMHDAVEIATNFKHWNYGLLDIAAQNGHTDTVKLILHDDLFSFYKLHERNGLNLSPWHLACMFNRSEVVEVFLQFNRSFVDWKCLYFAAEKGNIVIVKLLLDAGIYDECVLCTNKLYWIPDGTARVQGNMIPENDSMYVLFDDWSELACESALHAAIRQNHLNVVRELLKDSQHSTLHCFDRGGRPALIAALQNNRTEMVRLFLQVSNAHRIKVQCHKMAVLEDNIQIHNIELVKMNTMKCKAGHGIEHAISPMPVVLQNIFDHTKFDFNRRDEDDCLPIHYAACGNNVEYLQFLLQRHEMLFETLICFNNTNAFHSTIHCRAFGTFIYFINNDTLSKSSFGQNFKEYVLYLLKLLNNQEEYANNATDKIWSEMFKLMIEKFHVDISMMVDDDGNNMLHYIVKNGHFKLLKYLVAKKRDATLELLHRSSLNGKSQITYLAKYMAKRMYVRTGIPLYTSPHSSPHSVQQEQKKLSSSEYCFSLISRFLNQYGMFKSEDKITIMQQLLRRKSYNLVDVYLKYIIPVDELFKTTVFATFLDFDNTGYVTTNYLSFLLHDIKMQQKIDFERYEFVHCSTCQDLRYKCLAHQFTRKIALFQGNLNIHFGEVQEMIYRNVFKRMIAYTDTSILSSCVDQQGLNILELAINRKSLMLMTLFRDKGVQTKSPEELLLRSFKANDHIEKIPVTLLNSTSLQSVDLVDIHFHTHEQIVQIFNTTTKKGKQGNAELLSLMMQNDIHLLNIACVLRERHDHFYASFIGIYSSKLSKLFICMDRSANFSLIHVLALHGYSNTIERCVKYFGRNILDCLNIDHFTPLYLSKVYDKTNTTFNTILENSPNKHLTFPRKPAEKHFLYNLVTQFYFSKGEHRKALCYLRYLNRPKMNIYKTIKQYRCFKSITQYIITPKSYQLFLKDLKLKLIERSLNELRQSFLDKMNDLKVSNALVSVPVKQETPVSLSNMMKLKRFICIHYMHNYKQCLIRRNIKVLLQTKPDGFTSFDKYIIRLTLSNRFEYICKYHMDDYESEMFRTKQSSQSCVTKHLFKRFCIDPTIYFQKFLLRKEYIHSPDFETSFSGQRFRQVFRNTNEFKIFSDNEVYKYKYMDAFRYYPIVKFSFQYSITDHHKKIFPNFEYINSSMSSELVRNAYTKFKNAQGGEY
ncbi:uncharacterized protein LOC128242309 isoform X2 [Mya arenaria]|uniref:uncharacterized protein LOC128242309 isoform X2 n=1 Tax=Mya arenaria TaxID=6604 RepID=UPI0022E848EC|nr:uncharacterized protein LOC128242309 isoform X2 [Mya arenaria]